MCVVSFCYRCGYIFFTALVKDYGFIEMNEQEFWVFVWFIVNLIVFSLIFKFIIFNCKG
jgi:hypothetical protein